MNSLDCLKKPKHALTLLTRLARRRDKECWLLRRALQDRLKKLAEVAIEVARETGSPMDKILSESIRANGDRELVDGLYLKIPRRTLSLINTAEAIISVYLKDQEIITNEQFQAEGFGELGIRLGELGKREEALGSFERAIQLYRRKTNSDG